MVVDEEEWGERGREVRREGDRSKKKGDNEMRLY